MSTSTISRRRTDRPSLAQTFWLTLVVFFAFAGVHVPAAVAQVTITAGNGDVPITRVVLEANGNTVTQTSSQSGVSNGATSDPVMVREITINDNGNTVVLDEFNFVNVDVRHINFPPRCIQGATLCDSGTLTGVSVWDNGTVTDVQAPAFEADLEDALGDTDLMNFIRYDGINISGTNWEPDFDFVYTTPLTNDDYLLVMERNGNTFFDLIPLDINGDPIPGGQTVGFNKNYRWNTGFAPSENAGQPQWFTVADIEVFNVNTDNTPIYGFRIDNNGEADVKFFGLSPDVFVPPASIGDFVFDDLDGDGIQDPGEPGIENILVRLFDDNGQLITTTRTDANGNYLFPGLEPGTYVLHFVAPNGSIYSPRGVGNDGTVDSDVNPADGKTAGITVASGQDRTDIDAGIFTPAPGIKLNKNVYPGHNSGASCPGTDLTEGFVGDAITYCFIVENTGNTFLGDITLDDADINIDRTDLTLLSGTEPLAPGASLTFFFETALTGDLTNTASTSGNPTNANGNDLSGVPHVSDDDTAEVRAEQPASIGDFVFDDLDGDGIQDPGEPGIENILVRLFDDNNNLITTTRTDANGNYLFPGLEPGTYVLHFVAPNGSIYSPRGVGNDGTVDSDVNPADGKTTGITVAAGQDRTDIDAGIVTPAPGIDLNKNVYAGHDGGASCPGGDLTEGLVGDAITYCFVVENTGNTFLDAITVTDADISIDRSDLTLLSGTEPLAPGASLVFFFETALTGDLTNTASTSGNPTNANGTDIPGQQNLTDSDTAEVRAERRGSLGDTVFDDLDGDGIQDPGEPGIENILVRLFDDNNNLITTTRTDANGNYLFPGLTPGTYVIHVVAPNGRIYSPQGAGSDGTVDSDVNPADGKTAGITVASGQDRTDIDAGLVTPNAGIQIDKTVYAGHDNGASCAGGELVEAANGFAITYCFAVQNTGNVALDAITLTDADLGISRSDVTKVSGSEPVAPGASITFFFETTVTDDLVNTASTSGNPIDNAGNDIPGLQDPTDSDTAEVKKLNAAIQIDKTVYPGHDSGASCAGTDLVQGSNGFNVTYCFAVMNTGNTFLDAITVTDADLGISRSDLTLLSGTEPLAPGAMLTFFFETTITGDLVNTASTSGNPTNSSGDDIPGLQDPTDSDTATVDEVDAAIMLGKTVYFGHNGGAFCPGGESVRSANGANVTYCFEVMNTGNVALDAITLDDPDLDIDRSDLTLASGTEPLAPGASLVFFFETTISGDLVNTASASGNPVDGNGDDIPGLQDPSDDDNASVETAAPAIEIEKTVYAGHDNGVSCAGGELVQAANGTAITYCFAVTNTGDTFLDDVTVTDNDLGLSRTDLTLKSGTEPLAPGASLVFFVETTVTGDLVNTASTSGNPTDGNGADLPGLQNPTDSDTAEVDEVQAGIQIDKTVYVGHDSGASCAGSDLATGANGTNITYCFAVMNTGNTFLDAITVTDADLGINRSDLTLASGTEPLAPGASLVFFFETTITGDLVNTASTSGNPTNSNGDDIPNLPNPTDDDTATVDEAAAAIQIDKTVFAGHDSGASCPGGELVQATNGSTVTYCFTVTNTGSTFLDDITISDPALSLIRADLTQVSGTEPLAPGASLVFFFETTLTSDLTNTATTGGNPVDSNGNDLPAVPEPSDDDTAVVEDAAPRIDLSKTVFAGHDSGASCPGGELVTDTNGANITYCFAVKNTGTTFLNNVALTDADLGIDRSDLTLLSGTEPLAPNASLVFFFETTISGDLVNTASTSANPTDANGNDIPNLQDPTDTDTAEVREQADKIDLEVAKTVDMPAPDEGDQVTFTVSVVNNGPAVATGVEVTDTLPAGLGFISTNGGSQGSVSGTGPAIVWTVGTLGVNETATLEITVSVDAVGTFVNEAEVTAADQDDVDSTPNDGQGDDFARASVTSSDSSGGGAAGVESDGNMASKLATRLFERRQDAMARKALRAAPSPVILTTSSASARLSASKTTSLDLSEIVPEEGPQQSQAFVTTPRELLGVTNATSVFAVDYLRVDSRRLGAIFGATSPAGTLYDHTKNICDRLGGGRLQGVQQLAVGDQPFILSELVLADGQADYAVSFVAYRTGNSYVIDSRFTPDEYDVPVGTEEVINLQVWSVAPSYTADMVADVIDQFRAKGDVTFINTWEAAPTVPQVYIHSGEYANGVLTLRVFNGGDATTVEVEGTTSLTESNAANQVRDAFRTTVSVPQATEPGALVEVEVEVGYLFDAAFSIREVGTESVDRVYYSDGAWGISTPSDATVRTFEVYADEGTPTETTDYLVGRDAYLGGQVTTWASLFRYLRPAGQPIDLSAYDAIEFTAYGQGRISMLLEKASIETWDQFGTNFVLGTEPRSYRIAFDDLQLANGGGTFSANDVTSIVFYAQGSNGVASNFDLVVEDVRFTGNRSVDIEDPTDTLPTTITLGQNYPNPFNPTTTIPFTLSQQTDVRLAVYDVLGREVQVLVDGLWSAGSHTAVFEAGNLPSGTYLYRLEANGQTFGQTLVLMK